MTISPSSANGIQLLVELYRNEFRRPENTNYYAPDDYKEAERKFVKMCLKNNFVH